MYLLEEEKGKLTLLLQAKIFIFLFGSKLIYDTGRFMALIDQEKLHARIFHCCAVCLMNLKPIFINFVRSNEKKDALRSCVNCICMSCFSSGEPTRPLSLMQLC